MMLAQLVRVPPPPLLDRAQTPVGNWWLQSPLRLCPFAAQLRTGRLVLLSHLRERKHWRLLGFANEAESLHCLGHEQQRPCYLDTCSQPLANDAAWRRGSHPDRTLRIRVVGSRAGGSRDVFRRGAASAHRSYRSTAGEDSCSRTARSSATSLHEATGPSRPRHQRRYGVRAAGGSFRCRLA